MEYWAPSLLNFNGSFRQVMTESQRCPLLLDVDVYVLREDDIAGEDLRERIAGFTVAAEWRVHYWYPGHLMNDAGLSTRHDGRMSRAQLVLLEYVCSESRADFIHYVTDFLWMVILQSAHAQVKDVFLGETILNVRCKHGRHRSFGWAFLVAHVLAMQGVRIRICIPQTRLCSCGECNHEIDPMVCQRLMSISLEIECNIVELYTSVRDEAIQDAILDYVEWQDYHGPQFVRRED